MKKSLHPSINKKQTSYFLEFDFNLIKRILLLYFFFQISFVGYNYAQPWQQLGPGAGGQERALFYHKNVAGNYVLYVGSDVSGVWRGYAVNPNDLNNPDKYHFNYISNHRIVRFINKFCQPSTYSSNYLFVCNKSGIDRINLNDNNESMKSVSLSGGTFENSWVSDLYIGPLYNGKHQVYFTTGNTRVSDDVNKNHKESTVDDFYYGELNVNEDQITNISSVNFLLPFYRDAYCLYVDDIANADPNDDLFYTGTVNGMYVAYNSGTFSRIDNPISGQASKPYKVTSIIKFDATTLLVTIHGMGVYKFDTSNLGNPWTLLTSELWVDDQSNLPNGPPNYKDIYSDTLTFGLDFTHLFPLVSSGVIYGYLVTNENPRKKNSSPQYYVGLFYCDADANGLPNGIWKAVDAFYGSNDWGWNNSQPCSNINGACLTEDNQLYIGKQGNIFKAKIPITASSPYLNDWQQIYTSETSNTSSCTADNEFNHRGYVNTATNCVFPETSSRIWETQHDRLLWLDDGSGDSFVEIKKTNNNSGCYNMNLNTTLCNLNTAALSDAFFIDKIGNNLYAGIAEGFSINKGNGYVIKNDVTLNTTWNVEGNAICGDPVKFFIIGGIEYLLVNPASGNRVLYYLNGGTWTLITGYSWGNMRDVEMKTINSINHFFILANSGANSQTIYHYTGNLSSGSSALVCSVSNVSSDYNFERLKFLPFNSFTDFKILIGASPANPAQSNVPYFYELSSGNSCTLSPVPASNSIFKNLNLDLIDQVDEGITAIDVNTDRKIIYAATVSYDATQIVQVKSHLYKTSYTESTGAINSSWTEITNDAPNKTFTYLNSNNSTTTCNNQYVYACVRGLGAWKFEDNPVVITASNDVVCSGSSNASATASNPFGVAVTYLWSNLQTTQTATGLGAGSYTVSVTSGSCSASASILISEDPNCCNTYIQYLHQSNFNSGGTISTDWNLNENIICNTNIDITNANISIKEGLHITIPNNITVNIHNSSFFSCGNMWQGFVVENGGTLNIDNNSIIRDAQYGTHVKNNGNLSVDNTLFEHNYAGIYADNLSTGNISISGTSFKCTACLTSNPLKGAYQGQTPTPNAISYAGVLGVSSTFNIGVSGTNANHFEDLYIGVNLGGCYATVLNSDFKNIHASGSYPNTGGIGVYAFMKTYGNLRQYGFGGDATSPVSFLNCPTGIYTIGGDVSIGSNNMNNVSTGIQCSNAKAQNIAINYNNIDAINLGIALAYNDYANKINVTYNTVSINSPIAVGVKIFEWGTPSASRFFNVNCNSVLINDGLYGFHLLSTGNVSLRQNSSTIHTLQRYANAYALENSNNCNLTENYANGNSVDLHNGFFASMSDNNSLTNNHADNTANGFDYWNHCLNTIFKGNTMNRHNIGLHLNSSAVIGLQPSGNPALNNGNRWLAYTGGNNSTWVGAINQNTAGGFNGWAGSIFYTHIANSPSVYYPNYNASQVNGWFQPFPGTPFSATYTNICIAYADAPKDEEAMRLDTLIIQDSIYAVDFQPELRYNSKRSVYEKVAENDSLKNDNGLFENFYNSLQTENAGAYSDIKINMFQSINHVSELQLIDSLIQLKLDSIVVYDSLISTGNGSTTNLSKLFCLQILKNYIHQCDSLKTLINAELQQRKQVASSDNAALSFTNEIEQTEKMVNDFHFTYSEYSIDSIPQSNINSIENVASFCPFAYGVAVYKARAELARLGIDTIAYQDSSSCALLGYFKYAFQNSSDSLNNKNFVIWPNPANENITLGFNTPTQTNDFINIYSADGKLLYHINISNDLLQLKINTSDLAPSIYIIEYIHNNVSSFRKFSIIK